MTIKCELDKKRLYWDLAEFIWDSNMDPDIDKLLEYVFQHPEILKKYYVKVKQE